MTRDVNGIIVSHKLIKEAMHLVDWILKHPSIKVHLINILVWTPLYVQHWICIGVLQSFVFMNGINKCSSHFHLLHWPRYEDIRSIDAVIANSATSYLNQKPISPNMKTSDWKDYFSKIDFKITRGWLFNHLYASNKGQTAREGNRVKNGGRHFIFNKRI